MLLTLLIFIYKLPYSLDNDKSFGYFRRIGTEGNLQSRRPLGPQLIAIADK